MSYHCAWLPPESVSALPFLIGHFPEFAFQDCAALSCIWLLLSVTVYTASAESYYIVYNDIVLCIEALDNAQQCCCCVISKCAEVRA